MRIGFVLADLYTGSSASLWPNVASMFPNDGPDSLIMFPGGRLEGSGLDAMRNSIFRLVNPDNLDGAMIWSSTLTGTAGRDDVLRRFSNMLEKPVVTIDGKTKDHPNIHDVRFNAYEGTLFLVKHCIEAHNSRKIVYLRGPENHGSAQERYRAYVDALAQMGIAFDEKLVSDPVSWNDSVEAICQIVDERGLVPGKDFDTLFCASDMMLYYAVKELERRGYSVPRDIKVCGFNDSLEARLLNVPMTTVRLPYVDVARGAVKSFMLVAGGGQCTDMELASTPVVRRSCGCIGDGLWSGFSKLEDLERRISESLAISSGEVKALLDIVIKNPSESNIEKFVDKLCEKDANLFEISKILSSLCALEIISPKKRERIANMAWETLPASIDRRNSIKRFRERNNRSAFNSFNNDLIEANTISEIASVLDRDAASLGFESILLVHSDGERSTLVGHDLSFSDSTLIPEEGCEGICTTGVWIVNPLCTENEYMGYLLMKPIEFNGTACEDIRNAVSSAVKSSTLFEATRKAQLAAESAEQARTNFFANVGENLRDPLSEITEMVSASAMPEDSKDAIIEKIRGANQIIDLALGTTGELELNRCMENMGEFLSQFKCYADPTPLPCLMFDESRLRQAFEIVIALMDNNALIRASMTKKGVRIDILSNGFDWNPPKDDVGLLLAHEIFLMHGGSCTTGTTGFCAILPYPTLSGSYPSHWNDSDVLACINGRPPFEIEDAVMEDVNGSRLAEKKRLPSFSGAIYWDSAFKGYHALSILMCLTSNVVYRNMPFLCMDCPRSRTLEDSIRSSVEEKGKVVLQIGSAVDDLYRWLQAPDVVTCELKAAAAMCKQHEPVLVMLSMEGLEDRIDDVVEFLETLRGMRRISQTPTIICTDHLDYPVVNALADIPNIIVVNTCMLESDEFAMRVRAVLGGSELLATNTGAIVKKAQAYLCSHATMSISRWQVAEDVHVSEDYLTRVFKKELGLSPWDYLNRYRIWLACSLLMNTGMSINEIASATGFQDQAYFCRVFKKIRGYSPSKMRSGRKSELSKI